MKKAIIITNSTEYSTHKDFQNAIDNSKSCKYNNNHSLIKFLEVKKLWETTFTSCNGYRDSYRTFLNKECEPGIRKEDIPAIAIKEKMKDITIDTSLNPYASFQSTNHEWEVILVLCNEINIGRKQYIDYTDLFLDCICEDLEVSEEAGDNVLYVHAEQIGYINVDGMLVDNHESRVKDLISNENRVFKWAEDNALKFKRIAYFIHETEEKNLFKVNILSQEFLKKNKYSNDSGLVELTEDGI